MGKPYLLPIFARPGPAIIVRRVDGLQVLWILPFVIVQMRNPDIDAAFSSITLGMMRADMPVLKLSCSSANELITV